jgi:hypothetical protein
MKRAIIQYNVDISKYDEQNFKTIIQSTTDFIEKYSKLSFKSYCDKYDIDFIRVEEPKVNFKHPTWERLDLWLDQTWFEKYDEICYTDTDVFAMPWAPNIFSIHENDNFKKAKYHKTLKRDPKDLWWLYDISVETYKQNGFQTGVWILTKKSRNESVSLIKKYKEDQHKFEHDGQFVPYCVMKSGTEISNLPEAFNTKWWPNIGFNENVYFYHAFGRSKYTHTEIFKQQLFEIFGDI